MRGAGLVCGVGLNLILDGRLYFSESDSIFHFLKRFLPVCVGGFLLFLLLFLDRQTDGELLNKPTARNLDLCTNLQTCLWLPVYNFKIIKIDTFSNPCVGFSFWFPLLVSLKNNQSESCS